MSKPCDIRKISFRLTIKQSHILSMSCKLGCKNTTELLNDYIRKYIKSCINESKYAVDNNYGDYTNEFTKRTDRLNQLYTYKKSLVSFRLKKDVYDLLKNHFYFVDTFGVTRTPEDKELNKIVFSIIAYVLESKDFSKLCEDLDLDVDEVLNWINKEYKAIY